MSSGLLTPLDSPSPPNSTKIQGNEESTDLGISVRKTHGAERPFGLEKRTTKGNIRKDPDKRVPSSTEKMSGKHSVSTWLLPGSGGMIRVL